MWKVCVGLREKWENTWIGTERCTLVCTPSVTLSPVNHPLVTHQPYHTADPAMVTHLNELPAWPCSAPLLKMMQRDGRASFCFKRSESNVWRVKKNLKAHWTVWRHSSRDRHNRRRIWWKTGDQVTWIAGSRQSCCLSRLSTSFLNDGLDEWSNDAKTFNWGSENDHNKSSFYSVKNKEIKEQQFSRGREKSSKPQSRKVSTALKIYNRHLNISNA